MRWRNLVIALAMTGCGSGYSHGCSTQSRGEVVHGSIVVHRYANPYEAAKGRRFNEWCEMAIDGTPLESADGDRVAQGCDPSPNPDVAAIVYSWQGATGTSDTTLLEVMAGRRVEHALEGGGGGGWLAGGALYVSGGHVFDLVHHTEHDFHRKDLWLFDVSPDSTALAASSPFFDGRPTDFVVMNLGDGVVRTQTLSAVDHPWLNPGDGKPVAVAEHAHWVRGGDGTWNRVLAP